MKFHAVIDTNVIISALLSKHSDSATVKIMDAIFDGKIIPIFNEEILSEYSLVLRRKKFGFPSHLIEDTLESIAASGVFVNALESELKLHDSKDQVFYEVCISQNDSFLVTGNIKHFPKQPQIVTPAEMIHIMESMTSPTSSLLNEPQAEYGNTARL